MRWFSNQGSGPAHPLQRLAFQERTLSPGYAGAEASGNFHHLVGLTPFYATRLLSEDGILVVDDVNFPAVRSVINHLLTYPCYRLIGSVDRLRPLSRRQHVLRTLATLLPKQKREHFLSSYVCQLVDSHETQSTMVALKKVASDKRSWDWHEPFA